VYISNNISVKVLDEILNSVYVCTADNSKLDNLTTIEISTVSSTVSIVWSEMSTIYLAACL
jgi:hypothetical protein